MPQENVELHRRANEAFTRRDLSAFLALMDNGVEFMPYERAMEGLGPYRGHSGVGVWWEATVEAFPDLSGEYYEVRGWGDTTVASGRLHGAGAASGASFDRPLCTAAKWRDGKAVWWYAFGGKTEALRTLGLSE